MILVHFHPYFSGRFPFGQIIWLKPPRKEVFFVSAGRIEGKVPFFSGIDARIGKESNPGNSANVTFLGWIGGPCKGWNGDLQLGDTKITT